MIVPILPWHTSPCVRHAESEYHDPQNRRFHAQPNACPVCGPQLMLLNNEGFTVQTQNPISTVCTLLHDGKIVAVKGLGGYHLACDAVNRNAVSLLRKRKYRKDKPFAVMMESIETVNKFCFVNTKEETLLLSTQKPIVLLKKRVIVPFRMTLPLTTCILG